MGKTWGGGRHSGGWKSRTWLVVKIETLLNMSMFCTCSLSKIGKCRHTKKKIKTPDIPSPIIFGLNLSLPHTNLDRIVYIGGFFFVSLLVLYTVQFIWKMAHDKGES